MGAGTAGDIWKTQQLLFPEKPQRTALSIHQVRQSHVVHHVADGLIHLLPKIQSDACFAPGALVYRIIHTGNRGQAALYRPQNQTYGIILRTFHQPVASLCSTDAAHQAGAHQHGDNLLQILLADPPALGHRLYRQIHALLLHGKLQHQMQGVAALRRQLHGITVLSLFPILV